MGFFNFLTRKSRRFEDVIEDLDAGTGSNGISTSNAIEVTAVLACVDAIATSVAMPDLKVMRRKGEDAKEDRTDPAYRVIHRRPNEFQTAFDFRQMMTVHAALSGESIALPVRNTRGKLIEVLPVAPGGHRWERNSRYQIQCIVSDEFGEIGRFDRKDVFVLRSMSWDMVRSIPAVANARAAIGLASAAEKNMTDLYENGGRPSGVLSTENKLSADAIKRIKEGFAKFSTRSGKFSTALLDHGMKYFPMGMTSVDQQQLETRRFQVEEICRVFGVFPQMVMHADKTATYASAEAFFAAHNRVTAGKWQKIWCEQGDEFLLDGAGPQFLEFDNRGLNAASLKDTGDYYFKALGGGNAPAHMTQNEVRKERGFPPVEGGDVLFFPQHGANEGDPANGGQEE